IPELDLSLERGGLFPGRRQNGSDIDVIQEQESSFPALAREPGEKVAALRSGADDLVLDAGAVEEPLEELSALLFPHFFPGVQRNVLAKQPDRLELQPFGGRPRLVHLRAGVLLRAPASSKDHKSGDRRPKPTHFHLIGGDDSRKRRSVAGTRARRATTKRTGPHRDAVHPGTCSVHSTACRPAGIRTAENASWAGATSAGRPSRRTSR